MSDDWDNKAWRRGENAFNVFSPPKKLLGPPSGEEVDSNILFFLYGVVGLGLDGFILSTIGKYGGMDGMRLSAIGAVGTGFWFLGGLIYRESFYVAIPVWLVSFILLMGSHSLSASSIIVWVYLPALVTQWLVVLAKKSRKTNRESRKINRIPSPPAGAGIQ